MICVNSTTIKATIKEKINKYNIILDKPICSDIGEKLAILKNIKGKYTLYWLGELVSGVIFKIIKYNCNIEDYINKNHVKYNINYDIEYNKSIDFDYKSLLNNFNFNIEKSDNKLYIEPIKLSRKPRQTIVLNMYSNLIKIHYLTCVNFDYKNNFINFFNTEINKICRFNEDN